MDQPSGDLAKVHEYPEFRQHMQVFESIIIITDTVLNFNHVAYLSMCTLTGAP